MRQRLILQIFTKLAEKLDPDTCRGLFIECVQWTTLIHWTFLQTMIVGLCVRNSSYEKKQIDHLFLCHFLICSTIKSVDFKTIFLHSSQTSILAGSWSSLLILKPDAEWQKAGSEKGLKTTHIWHLNSHSQITMMTSNLKLRGEYVLHIDVAERSAQLNLIWDKFLLKSLLFSEYMPIETSFLQLKLQNRSSSWQTFCMMYWCADYPQNHCWETCCFFVLKF
jgi:hypothetical protein